MLNLLKKKQTKKTNTSTIELKINDKVISTSSLDINKDNKIELMLNDNNICNYNLDKKSVIDIKSLIKLTYKYVYVSDKKPNSYLGTFNEYTFTNGNNNTLDLKLKFLQTNTSKLVSLDIKNLQKMPKDKKLKKDIEPENIEPKNIDLYKYLEYENTLLPYKPLTEFLQNNIAVYDDNLHNKLLDYPDQKPNQSDNLHSKLLDYSDQEPNQFYGGNLSRKTKKNKKTKKTKKYNSIKKCNKK
jgi:hypothetical protein